MSKMKTSRFTGCFWHPTLLKSIRKLFRLSSPLSWRQERRRRLALQTRSDLQERVVPRPTHVQIRSARSDKHGLWAPHSRPLRKFTHKAASAVRLATPRRQGSPGRRPASEMASRRSSLRLPTDHDPGQSDGKNQRRAAASSWYPALKRIARDLAMPGYLQLRQPHWNYRHHDPSSVRLGIWVCSLI